MSSRISLDTTSLTIRDVFCLNRNADVIQPISIPVPGANGKLQWLSSVEFLSTISVPTTSTSLLNYIQQVGSTFSTLSTMFNISSTKFINSTIAGLGSIPNGNDYLSSSALVYQFRNLAANYGYVSTVNPGNYRIYKSTLRLQGNNIATAMVTNDNVPSGTVDIGGFASKVVNTSQMRIDVNANIVLAYPTQLPSLTTFSTVLVNTANSQILGDPVSLTFNAPNALVANLSFMLNSAQLTPFPTNLQLRHVLPVGNNLNLTTNIPQIGGIFVTLDNTD